jgi:chitinase
VTFGASTDAVGVTGYAAKIGIAVGGVCTPNTLVNPTWSTATTQQLVNLVGGLTYCLLVQGFDAAQNLSLASNTATFTMLTVSDPVPPSDVSTLTAPAATLLYNSITFNWPTATDNVGIASYDIYRCSGAGCTNFSVHFSAPAPTYTDMASILPVTVYRYIVKAKDFAGNPSANASPILDVTTPDVPSGTTFGICPCRNRTK